MGDNPDISQANKVFAERKPPLLPTTSPNKTRRQMNYINPLTREFPTYLNSGIESTVQHGDAIKLKDDSHGPDKSKERGGKGK